MTDAPMLKACPFCGGTASMFGGLWADPYVACNGGPDEIVCDARGPSRGTEPAAIAAWNRRATEREAIRLVAEWVRGQRNDVPATGEEFANAILANIDSLPQEVEDD